MGTDEPLPTLSSTFEELRRIAEENSWHLQVPQRANRANPLVSPGPGALRT
jgi:hypothetical protein